MRRMCFCVWAWAIPMPAISVSAVAPRKAPRRLDMLVTAYSLGIIMSLVIKGTRCFERGA
ncbi:exported protein of unknown function [Azospirillum baldaniorum]|uniref:Uncharacterized protein n=1 Tax=Azospirillum baldaniorum TaxID=1064539 RepID=A0A9P1JPE5_9PROT|nr:exported protein of unknown function [Azospirillum baldaniorum]